MVWRKLLGIPKEGGGNLQRLFEVRKQLFIKNWTETSLTSDKVFKGPITLFDFARPHDQIDAQRVSTMRGATQGWKMADDGSIGGFSQGSLLLYTNDISHGRDVQVDAPVTESQEIMTQGEVSTEKSKSNFQPFVRWKGNLSTRLPPAHPDKPPVLRSGYCYIRLPEFPGGIPLKNKYNALEIKCRASDAHLYAVNLKASTFLPDDLYQGFLQFDTSEHEEGNISNSNASIPIEFQTEEKIDTSNPKKKSEDDSFKRLVLPFRDFVLTAGGRPREYQRKLDGNVTIEHIGFMLADGEDGDFEFDLARIRVVNHSKGEILDDDDDNVYLEEQNGEEMIRESKAQSIN